jgi:hypothetical protein
VEPAPDAGGATIVDPGNFAQYVFTVVVAVAGLGVAFGVTRRLAFGGPSRWRRLRQGTDTDPGQQAAVLHLADEVEAMRAEIAANRRALDEVQNRLDFAERLLAQSKERGLLTPPKEG